MSRKARRRRKNIRLPLLLSVVAVIVIISAGALLLTERSGKTSSTTAKPVILYVNQGNALVSVNNFTGLTAFAKSNGFNTIFFQVYRGGNLIFSASNLTYFVTTAHSQGLKIFFALYFTASGQQIPSSLYTLGENGISLDMSTLSDSSQAILLSTLQHDYMQGETAVTTTNFTTDLRPNLLILETYGTGDQSFIHHGIIGGVEPYILSSKQEYTSQFQYALQNSDGVMVFDYYGLLRTGY
jgi:hypothetical protein